MTKAIEAAARAIEWALTDHLHAEEAARDCITAYLAAMKAEGFVMVPAEPTEGMVNEGSDCTGWACDDGGPETARLVYRAMIAASTTHDESRGSYE